MEDIEVVGLVTKPGGEYAIVTDDGHEYRLSAILPWAAVSADYGTDQFERCLGKRMMASGVTDGGTIWNADLSEVAE